MAVRRAGLAALLALWTSGLLAQAAPAAAPAAGAIERSRSSSTSPSRPTRGCGSAASRSRCVNSDESFTGRAPAIAEMFLDEP